MGTKDERVDAYIAKSAPFARPVLKHLRRLVHKVCPKAEETIKWGCPHFMYGGILCGMPAFKQHCALIVWPDVRAAVVAEDGKKTSAVLKGLRQITSLDDLPSDAVIVRLIEAAVKMRDAGVKPPKKARRKKKPATTAMPAEFLAALKKNKRAHAAFEKFAPGYQREYIEWIADAKRDVTRAKRIATAVEWIAAGKTRNWKYRPGQKA